MSDALRAKYGTPVRLANRAENVFVFRHPSEESARAFAAANNEGEDAGCSTVEREGDDWLTVVDIGPAIARIDAQFKESQSV